MVATSVAGRGLDVPEICVVVNYNCPNHIEEYVHRVGRTGRAGRKGTAYTFLSPNEDQYAPMMCKCIEKSGQPVPQELLDMAKLFKEKVARGDAHWAASGFVGNKGFSFDASEMSAQQQMASSQRRAYEIEQGLHNDADEAAGLADLDDEFGLGTDSLAATSASSGNASSTIAIDSAAFLNMTPLEKAKALAASIGASKSMVSVVGAAAAATGSVGAVDPKAALARARLIAQQMASKGGGGLGVEGALGLEGKETEHYSDEVEINDYPAQARRKVTSRSSLEELTDRTQVAIISRGTYIPPNKKPEPGERKLYLLIEGSNEMQVKFARHEILKTLEEETLRLGAATPGASGSSGRYSVL